MQFPTLIRFQARMILRQALCGLLLCGVLLARNAAAQTPAGTAFTYQGILSQSGSPASGTYDIQFTLYNDPTGGLQKGATLTLNDVTVDKGRLTVNLDFGFTVFADDEGRWMQIAVRPGTSSGAYTVLTPRQALKPTPYAIMAQGAVNANVVPWGGIAGVPYGTSGSSKYLARADHTHDDLISSATVNEKFVHQNGSGTIVSSDTLSTLYVTQLGKGRAGNFVSPGDIALYASTSASPHFKPGTMEGLLLRIYPAAIYGAALNGGNGVYGETTSGNAIYGTSQNGNGVAGNSVTNGSGGSFSGPTGVTGTGTGTGGIGGVFSGNGSNGFALQANGSATVTLNLAVGSTVTAHNVAFSAPKIHILSVPAEAFHPKSSSTTYNMSSNGGIGIFSAGAASLTAPVNLPQGAVITSLKAFFYNEGSLQQISLHLWGVKYNGGGYYDIASVNSLSIAMYGSKTANATTNTIVDNQKFGYLLTAYANQWDGFYLLLMGVVITYTTTDAE